MLEIRDGAYQPVELVARRIATLALFDRLDMRLYAIELRDAVALSRREITVPGVAQHDRENLRRPTELPAVARDLAHDALLELGVARIGLVDVDEAELTPGADPPGPRIDRLAHVARQRHADVGHGLHPLQMCGGLA